MSKQDALNAYRDSLYDASVHEFNSRAGSRSFPIVGGLVDGLKLLGNGLVRPFKVGGALVMGYTPKYSEFPSMPQVPPAFQGTDLGKAFEDSWPLNQQAADARVSSFGKLLNLDISGAWQDASVANYARAKENNLVFVDEAAARNASADANRSFVDLIAQQASSRGSRDF